ncbi:ribose-5-phosphate isomerase [bacterium]|nr:ribose-5-phosphate isomerase [bacterium]|tara:strand:+ start:8363 stop:8812 length:450 start_codon:yes stop_codon:yes gene_type:complete
MHVILGTDHAGFTHKEAVGEALRAAGHEVIDCGAMSLDPTDDYPDFIAPAMERLKTAGPDARAVIFGGSGQGEAMLANRYRHVRAVVYYGGPKDILTLSREHNDANVLSLGARFMSEAEAVAAVEQWLPVAFSGDERHVRRLQKFNHAH